MKRLVLFLLVAFIGSQIAKASESYQRWIYWVSEPSHQVTADEMADITAFLYDGMVSNKNYKLGTGVIFKIPKPELYLQYIEKCVRAAKPSANTPALVCNEIRTADKNRWGNDVSVKVKNYFFSTAVNDVRSINNFSGEGKDVDFLFIDGTPTIKCDCGNPLEGINVEVIKDVPVKTEQLVKSFVQEDKEISVVFKNYNYNHNYEKPIDLSTKREECHSNAFVKTLVKIAACAAGAYVGFKLYDLCKNQNNKSNNEDNNNNNNNNNENNGDNGGGPGGAPTSSRLNPSSGFSLSF